MWSQYKNFRAENESKVPAIKTTTSYVRTFATREISSPQLHGILNHSVDLSKGQLICAD